MKHIVLFVLMLIPSLVSAVTTTVYDFSNRTAGSNIFAFEGVSGTQIPLSNSLPSSQYSASSYSDITSNNNVYHDYINYAKNEYPAIRYVIEIDENISNINQLDVFWNGFGVNSKNNQIDGVLIYIWNNSNNSYELVTQNTNDWVVELSQSVTSNITDYIDNDNKITVYVVSQGKTFNGETNWIGTDYFSLSITSESSVVPIANFKFDETQYDDVAGEIKDSVGTFHSRAKSAQPVDGKVCRALDLSATGTADYAIIDNNVLDGKKEFSISLWEKTAKTGNQSFLSGATSGSNNELIMWFTRDTSFSPHLQNSANGSLPISSIAGDQWRHLVWTHGDNKSCFFIDKVAQGCITQATNTLDIESLILGQEQDSVGGRFSSSQAFDGLLDELVIFDQVIGQGQIDEIYDFQNNGLDLDGEPIVCPDIPPVEFASPIANFKFDETEYADVAEEVKDSVGNFHSQAKLAQPVDGKVCRAVDLSTTGTGDYIVLDKDVLHDKDEFSISLWAKTAKESNQSLLSGASSGSNNELIMWFNSDTRFIPYLQNGQNGTLSTSSIAGNTWHHLVWTHGRNRSCLFIDKEAQGCVTQTTSTLNIESLILGQEQDSVGGGFSSSQAFNGLIDELIIFEDAIGQEQINQIYDYQNNGLGLAGEVISCNNEIIAQYSMEETSWNDVANEVIDETGNFDAQGVDGASTSNATPALTGNPGTCGYGSFDGVDDYIELPSTFENLQDSFTITAWINPSNLNSGSRIFIDDQNNQQGFGFSLGDPGNGRLRFFSRGVSPISVDTNSSIAANTWSFVTAVHNSVTKTRQIYINGVAQAVNGTSTSSTYTGTWGVDTGPASIGGETSASGENGSNFHFTGAIDEVHVFKGALSAAEINEVYAKRHACAEPVIHHYKIVHDGNGLTCAVEPITIKACTNSDCSASSDLSTESVSLDFTITSPTDGTSIKFSPTFTGSTSFDFNYTKAETITLSIDGATIAASNPIECSGFGSSCDMTFSDAGYILTLDDHNSCTIPNLVIQAVKLSDNGMSCAPAYVGAQPVDLTFTYSNPVTGTKLPKVDNIEMAANGVAQRKVITFDTNATATLPFQYNDAGQINIAISEGSDSGLSSDNVTVVVSPDKLLINAFEANSACPSANPNDIVCNKFKAAGENFTLDIAATCADETTYTPNFELYNIALNVKTVAPLLSPENPVALGITSFDFVEDFGAIKNGIIELAGQSISEVGVFTITATPPVNGYFNKTIPIAVSKNIGRFIPKYFTVSTVFEGELENSNGGSFAYTGELNKSTLANGAISYKSLLEPEVLITAYNAGTASKITKNYTANFMMLDETSFTITSPIFDISRVEKTIDTDVVAAINVLASNLSDEGDGTIKYKFSDTDHYLYTRNEKSLIDKYTADINIQIDSIIDTDDVATDDTDTDGNNGILTLDPNGIEIRFGRWNIDNTYGPETADLPLPMSVQYWNGSQFVVNELDSLTAYDGSVASNYTKDNTDLSPQLATGVVNVSDAGPMFNLGLGQLLLSQPTDGSRGQIRVTYEDVPTWLKFNWNTNDENNDGNIFDDNPSGVATFGLYRGNDRIISWREVTN